MKRYRLLVKGRNFRMNHDGKLKKYGFVQNMFVEADTPSKAKLIAVATTKVDKELNGKILNSESDPPHVYVETFWELDVLDNINNLDTHRHFFVEKRWWQFWK